MFTLRKLALMMVALGALLLLPVAAASADGLVVIDCPTITPPPPCPINCAMRSPG